MQGLWGARFCLHQRRRNQCKECGGASICPHQRMMSICKECGGAGLCPHHRQKEPMHRVRGGKHLPLRRWCGQMLAKRLCQQCPHRWCPETRAPSPLPEHTAPLQPTAFQKRSAAAAAPLLDLEGSECVAWRMHPLAGVFQRACPQSRSGGKQKDSGVGDESEARGGGAFVDTSKNGAKRSAAFASGGTL
jgi:hypothetical protein